MDPTDLRLRPESRVEWVWQGAEELSPRLLPHKRRAVQPVLPSLPLLCSPSLPSSSQNSPSLPFSSAHTDSTRTMLVLIEAKPHNEKYSRTHKTPQVFHCGYKNWPRYKLSPHRNIAQFHTYTVVRVQCTYIPCMVVEHAS